jgi:hypothetical protein
MVIVTGVCYHEMYFFMISGDRPDFDDDDDDDDDVSSG